MQPDRAEALAARALPWILAVAVVLRLTGLGWDGYVGLHPDERNLVAGAAALSFPDRMLPDFLAYNGLSLWLPRLVAPLCPGAGDAACLTWAARLVSALFGILCVVAGTAVVRALVSAVAACLAAVLLGLSEPMVQWAHFGTTESAMATAPLVLWLLAIRYLRGGMTPLGAGLTFGAVLGAALAMKTTAASFALIPLAAWLLGPAPGAAARLLAVAIAVLLATAIFLLGTPSILFDSDSFFEAMAFERGVVSGAVPVPWTRQFEGAQDGLFELRQLWLMTEGAGLLLAALGLWLAVGGRSLRLWMPGLAFAAAYLVLILPWQGKFVRYLAPVLPILLCLAACGAAWLLDPRRWLTLRIGAMATLGLVAASGLSLWVGHLGLDPRQMAATDLTRRAGPDAVVLTEPMDLGAHLLSAETRLVPLDPPVGPEAMANVLAAGDFLVLFSRRHWSVLPRVAGFEASCRYYAALADGSLGYEAVAIYRRAAPLHGLLAPGMASEETRVVFDRPEVIVFERVRRLDPAAMAAVLAQPGDPSECAPRALAAVWSRPR